MKIIYLGFLLIFSACQHSNSEHLGSFSNDGEKKKWIPPSGIDAEKSTLKKTFEELKEIVFKETSRNPHKKIDNTQTHRIVFSFNEQGNVVEFTLSCMMRNHRQIPQEMFSDRSIGIILSRKVHDLSRISFEIPRDYQISLKVTEDYTYYNENNENQTDSCIETLRTGDYFFYPAGKDFFEVQVNGHFYMYMQKE